MGKIINEKNKSSQIIKQDALVGFVQIKSELKDQPVQIMLVGKDYAYRLDQGSAEALQIVHSTSEQNYWRLKPSQECDCRLRIGLKEGGAGTGAKHGLDFEGNMTLYYQKPVMSAAEVAEMQRLGAKIEDVQINNHQKRTMFVKNIHFSGQVVGLNKQIKRIKYQGFSQNYPIDLYSPVTVNKSVDYPLLLKKIAITPFALIGDVFFVPLIMLSDAF